MNFGLAEKLNKFVLANQLEKAIEFAEKELIALPKTDFHKIIGKDLIHLTEALTNYICEFHKTARNKINVKAIYSEMNGFTINYDLWFIDLFEFKECGGLDNLDWLSDFEVSSDDSMTITGFEELQTVYEDYMENEKWKDKKLEEACEICELLIILRLQELFQWAKKSAISKKLHWAEIPIFVTAHDYDMIYEARS